jgi:hypothetical protein
LDVDLRPRDHIAECEAALTNGEVSYHLRGQGRASQRAVASPRKGVAAVNQRRPRPPRPNDYVLREYMKSQSVRKQCELIKQFDEPAVEAS